MHKYLEKYEINGVHSELMIFLSVQVFNYKQIKLKVKR